MSETIGRPDSQLQADRRTAVSTAMNIRHLMISQVEELTAVDLTVLDAAAKALHSFLNRTAPGES